MGVKGLHSYMERRMPPRDFAIGLHELRARANGADMVVVDGMALIRRLYPQELDWVGGGQFLPARGPFSPKTTPCSYGGPGTARQ